MDPGAITRLVRTVTSNIPVAPPRPRAPVSTAPPPPRPSVVVSPPSAVPPRPGAVTVSPPPPPVAPMPAPQAGPWGATPGVAPLGQLPLSVAGRFKYQAIDDKSILTETVQQVGGKQAADTFDDLQRATTGNSANAQLDRYMKTGVVSADGKVKTPPPAPMIEMYRSWDPDTQARFDQGMTAAVELGKRGRGEAPTTALGGSSLLRKQVQRAQAHPETARMMQAYDDVYRGMSDERLSKGIITSKQHAKEQAGRYNASTGVGGHMPYRKAGEPRTIKERIGTGSPGTLFLGSRTAPSLGKFDKGGVGTLMSPMQAMAEYVARHMDEISHVEARHAFLKQVADAPIKAQKGNRTVVQRGRGKGGKDMLVKGEWFSVGDPRIASALQYRSHAVSPTWNTFRKVNQVGTTGVLQPLFQPLSMMYDWTYGMIDANANRMVTGLIDTQLAKAGFSPSMRNTFAMATRLPDFAIMTGVGLKQQLHGRLLQMQAERLAQRAMQLGTPTSQQAAERAAKVFMDSKYGIMQRQGYAANSLTDDLVAVADMSADTVMTALRYTELGKAVGPGLKRTRDYYTHLLESIGQSVRMGMFSRNLAYEQWLRKSKGLSPELTRAEYHRIANVVRKTGSDPTLRGANDTMNKVMSGIPYGNIIWQSAAHLMGQTITSRAALSVVGTVTIGAWYARNQMSPEARDFVENGQPAYKDIMALTIEVPHEGEPFDPDKHLYRIPLGPELGLLTHGALALFDGMMTTMSQEYASEVDPTTAGRLWEVVGDALSLPTPPLINIALNAAGLGNLQPGALLDDRPITREKRDFGNGMSGFRGIGLDEGLISDRTYNMLYSALGTFGRSVGESAETFDVAMNKYGKDFADAAAHAAGVFYHDTVARSQVGQLFTKMVAPPTPGTRGSAKAYELGDTMERISDMARMATTRDTSSQMDADVPYSEALTIMPQVLSEEVLVRQADDVRSYMLSSNHQAPLDRVGQLRKSYYQTASNKMANRNVVNTVLHVIDEQMQANYSLVLDGYGEFEKRMRIEYDDPEWTLTKFVDAAEADYRDN